MFIDRTFITQRILPKKLHATIHRLLHPRFLILDHITQITNREPIPFAPKSHIRKERGLKRKILEYFQFTPNRTYKFIPVLVIV